MTCEACGVVLTVDTDAWVLVDRIDITKEGDKYRETRPINPVHWYCGAHKRKTRYYKDTPDGRVLIEEREIEV